MHWMEVLRVALSKHCIAAESRSQSNWKSLVICRAVLYLSMVAKVSFRQSDPNPKAKMDNKAVGRRMKAMTKLTRTMRA